jgi:phosphatidate cytidylyltransferase
MGHEGEDPRRREEQGERAEGFDDLFEDLDRFFAPDPAEVRRRRDAEARGTEGDAEADPGAGASTGEGDLQEPEQGETTAEDLLPSDWRPDIESLRADPPDEQDEADDAGEHGEEGEESPPASTGAAGAWARESTAEMSGQEWNRLRDVLGEEQDEGEALAYQAETPDVATDEGMFDYEEEGEGDRPDWLEPGTGHELTLEDMKKPPPEYRDLPGPRGGPEAPKASSSDRDLGPPGPAGAEDRPEPAAPERPAREPMAPEPLVEEPSTAPEGSEWPEPTIAEVEAAADQLAEEFRDAEGPSEVEADLLADLDEPAGPRTVRVGAPESMTGPTWEEPTSRPIMAEGTAPAAPGPGRDLPAAVITAAVLGVAALIALLIAKAAFVLVAGAVVLLGQAELYATMRRRGHQPATALGLVVGAFMMAGAYRKGEAAIAFFVVLALLMSFLWYMAAPLKGRENLINNVGSTLLGVLYAPGLASYVFLLLAQPSKGKELMISVIGLSFIYDIAAYFFGSFWGSRSLAPTISPRKSWEGLFGATVVTFIVAIALVPAAVDYLSVTKAIGLAIVIIVFAPLGDLIESMIKRDLGVKDMGSLLPGHGGVLDRIDSVLLVAPAAFYFIRLVL